MSGTRSGGSWNRVGKITVATALAVALAATACSKSNTDTQGAEGPPASKAVNKTGGATSGPADSGTPTPGGRLAFAIEAEPEGLDPSRYALSESGHTVASAVYDPLATVDENGKAVPYLAKSIEGSDGNKTWTITLPSGVKFHDGTPLTAQVVKDNFEVYRKSYVTAAAMQTVTDISVPNETQVVVKLNAPWAAFPTAMTSQVGYVMAPAMLTNPDLVNKPIGTGPFVFDGHVPSQSWSFKKNPTYWKAGRPYLDAIDFKPIPDSAQRLSQLQSGDIDIMHTSDAQTILSLRSDPQFKEVENNAGSEEFVNLNTQAEPFNNLNARMAVAYATDAEGYRKQVYLGVPGKANSPFAPGQAGYSEDNGFPTLNVDKAKEYVAKYKQETGKDLEVSLLTAEDPVGQRSGQFLVGNWTAAGIKTTSKALPQINLIAAEATGSYQAGLFRNFSFPDPDTDTVFWRSTSVLPSPAVSLNFPRYVDQRVDDLIGKALASTDPNERNKAYQDLAKIWAENLPYVWLQRWVWVLAAQPRVNGIYAAANGTIETIGAKTWITDLWIKR